jgi:ribosomal protein L21
MAKQYKVIAGAFPYVQTGRVYNSQEVISGDELLEGDAEEAVAEGFIEEVAEEASVSEETKTTKKKK